MFNSLFSLFKSFHINKMADTLSWVERIVTLYENEFEKDHDAHIAAYDSLIQILEAQKKKIIEAKNGSKNQVS